ncbi:hypothetical protein GRJ2_001168600 [Grus japonensis]|uniref:Uncharacterized protein n=1 Tax=Grus japonensis TaxID=30415 RepID=A0ABC9WNK2_GRUJA
MWSLLCWLNFILWTGDDPPHVLKKQPGEKALIPCKCRFRSSHNSGSHLPAKNLSSARRPPDKENQMVNLVADRKVFFINYFTLQVLYCGHLYPQTRHDLAPALQTAQAGKPYKIPQ